MAAGPNDTSRIAPAFSLFSIPDGVSQGTIPKIIDNLSGASNCLIYSSCLNLAAADELIMGMTSRMER